MATLMLEQALCAVHDLYSKMFSNVKEYALENPDDPLLVADEKNIPFSTLAPLTGEKLVFRCKKSKFFCFTVWQPYVYRKDLAVYFPLNQNGEYEAEQIDVRFCGLCILGKGRYFCIGFPGVEQKIVQAELPKDMILEGEEAYLFWEFIYAIRQNVYAFICHIAAERNPQILFDIRNESPHILKHPYLQHTLSVLFSQNRLNEPLKKPGGHPNITPQIFELYHAAYKYLFAGESITNACIKAVTHYPEIVPTSWKTPKKHLERVCNDWINIHLFR